MLGVDSAQAVAKLAADLPANGDGRAQVITLALVLGALESRTPKDAWRNATPLHPQLPNATAGCCVSMARDTPAALPS